MRITAFLPTHDLPAESMPWMIDARNVFDELLIFIDEKRVTPGTVKRAKQVATRVQYHKAGAWLDWDRAAMARACGSEWVFLIERDEQLSPEWQQNQWRQILETTEFTHFWIPRRWIVPGQRYISADPWWPALQLRLFRNNLRGTKFPAKLHDIIYVPGESGCFRHLALNHHDLWLSSRAAREEKVRFYEQLCPGGGLGHFYLYEDYAPPEGEIPTPIQLDPDREIVRMDKLPAEAISNVTLEVSAVPTEVQACTMFWVDAKVTNATGRSLYPMAPHPVYLSYHWIEKTTGQVIHGNRSGLFPGLEAGATERYPMTVIAPNHPGEYVLQTTMVQEGIFWFENIHPKILQEFAISVTAETAEADSGSVRMRKA